MIRNNDIDIDDFITFTSGGIKIAEFTQVRDALVNRYKLAYGNDIDLSTGTADGVFINDLALIINNILQAYKNLYANLDVNTANGEYLDALCALSNVTRLPETHSMATLTVTNNGSSTWESTALSFIDKNGIEWYYNSDFTLEPAQSKDIQVTCVDAGPIEAPAGWIYQTLEVTELSVVQSQAAILGEYAESDSQLRNRRGRSNAASGITVLEALIGGLLTISGVKDVYIVNNQSGSPQVQKDTVAVAGHSIYPVLRYREGLTIDKKIIGDIIYEKLTPGIVTTDLSGEHVTHAELVDDYEYVPNYMGVNIENLTSKVCWKIATGVNPQIEIKIKGLNNFSTAQLQTIGEKVKNYANELSINSDLVDNNIIGEILGVDSLFLGRPTFSIGPITITGAVSGVYSNPLNYYNYTNVSVNTTLDNNNYYTITIS